MKNLLLVLAALALLPFGCDSSSSNSPVTVVAPVLVIPVDTATDIDLPVVFIWSNPNSDGTVEDFDLQVSTSTNFDNPIEVVPGISDTTYTLTTLTGNTSYWWRVAANAGTISRYSNISMFTTGNVQASIMVTSTPSGATINIDSADTQQITPYMFNNVEPGTHTIKLYKSGYQEFTQQTTVQAGQTAVVEATLQANQWPIPEFVLFRPLDEDVYTSDLLPISGRIDLRHQDGTASVFTGTSAIATLNGQDIVIPVNPNNGIFNQDIEIAPGTNTFSMRATTTSGSTGYSPTITFTGDFEPALMSIKLTWSTANSDLDLHVITPDGEHCYYLNMDVTGGYISPDASGNYGPETFTATSLQQGDYLAIVNCFDLGDDQNTNATIVVDYNDTDTTYGPHLFTTNTDPTNDPDFTGNWYYNLGQYPAWWSVTAISVSGRSITTHKPTAQQLQQAAHILNMATKK